MGSEVGRLAESARTKGRGCRAESRLSSVYSSQDKFTSGREGLSIWNDPSSHMTLPMEDMTVFWPRCQSPRGKWLGMPNGELPSGISKPHPRRPAGRALLSRAPGTCGHRLSRPQEPAPPPRKWPSLGSVKSLCDFTDSLFPEGLTLSGTLMLQAGVSQEKTPQCSQEGLGRH